MKLVRVLEVLGHSAGGIARHVAQVVSSLDGVDGMEIDIAAPTKVPVPWPKAPLRLDIPDGVWGHRRAARELARLSAGYDVVHAHGLRATIDAGMAGRRRGTRVLSTIHNLVVPEVAGSARALLQRPAEPLAVRAANHVLAVSEEIAQRLKTAAGRNATPIEVLHLGIGDVPQPQRTRAEIRDELSVAKDQRLVVSIARLSKQKALDVLLEAFARQDVPSVLAIAGEGPLEAELKRNAESQGLSGRVRFLGFRTDATDLIAAADVFCLSSVWEGVPLAAQEAIALKVPVVGTDVGGMPELITDGVSGRLVPKNDAHALARALQHALSDTESSRKMASAAIEDLHRNFSTAHMLIRLTQLYRGDQP